MTTPEPELNVEVEVALHEAIFDAIYSAGTTHKVQKLAVDNATVKLQALIQQVSDQRVREALEAAIKDFDMAEWMPEGTMMDPHMMARSKEEVDFAKRYNQDHAWAALYAQDKLKKRLATMEAADYLSHKETK
jgi:hypothetical protein